MHDAINNTLTFLLAGGKGTRLWPITESRPKPFARFGGKFKIIDAPLTNLYQSGFKKVYVPTQYYAHPLNDYMKFWNRQVGAEEFYTAVSPQQTKSGMQTFDGTADAIIKNLDYIKFRKPEYIAVFGADHIYKMDVRDMLQSHIDKKADLTIAALEVSVEKARGFGVFDVDHDGGILNFYEKPQNPPTIPGSNNALGSMGNYFFTTEALVSLLETASIEFNEKEQQIKEKHMKDLTELNQRLSQAILDNDGRSLSKIIQELNGFKPDGLDFGKDVIPHALDNKANVKYYNFTNNPIFNGRGLHEKGYWEDVGTIDAYFNSHMDLVSDLPKFNIFDKNWKLLTDQDNTAGFKNTKGDACFGTVLVCGDSIATKADINRSVIGVNCHMNEGSRTYKSILHKNVVIGKGADVQNAIILDDVKVPDGMKIGHDLELDKKRGFTVESGIVVVPKNINLEQIVKTIG